MVDSLLAVRGSLLAVGGSLLAVEGRRPVVEVGIGFEADIAVGVVGEGSLGRRELAVEGLGRR